MKTKAIYAAAALSSAILFGTPTTASAQADDAQDRLISDGSSRYENLREFDFDAALDRETGLIWDRNPNPALVTWDFAQHHCWERLAGRRGGWRLPTVEELTSLLDYNFGEPGGYPGQLALAPGHPFDNLDPNLRYWTSTTHPSSADDFRKVLVQLTDGDVDDAPRYGSALGIAFCVRFRQGEGK